jgi:hypothetical protein
MRPTFMRSSRNSSQHIEAPEVTVAGLRHALTLLRFIRPGDAFGGAGAFGEPGRLFEVFDPPHRRAPHQ